MSRTVFPRLRRIGFGWWLGLLLALPLAQSAAAWHEVSHLGGAASHDDASLPHDGACALCLAAAAVDAGGLPVAALPVLAPDVTLALVPLAPVAAPAAAPALAYRSRAPPRALA